MNKVFSNWIGENISKQSDIDAIKAGNGAGCIIAAILGLGVFIKSIFDLVYYAIDNCG